jgi:biopolymer transport protein ExbD
MSFSAGGDDGGDVPSTLSEINVTPLVDVMLVLLTIFMVASSVETLQVKEESRAILEEKEDDEDLRRELERLREMERRLKDQDMTVRRERRMLNTLRFREDRVKELEEKLEDRSQNVPISLPKVNSEAVNLAEERKLVVVMTRDLKLYVGDTLVTDCATFGEVDPSGDTESEAFRKCLTEIGEKLVANKKLQDDKECYLKSDKDMSYGKVLALMATIRKAGITKFGLVADELMDAASDVKGP